MKISQKVKKYILPFFVLCYSVLVVFISIIEPISWFIDFKSLKLFWKILIYTIPLVVSIIYWIIQERRKKITNSYLGIINVSNGSKRDDAFQSIRDRAQSRIIIVGVGMTNISRYAEKSLRKQARNLPIDFLMIDPEFLVSNKNYAIKLEEFLGIPNFCNSVQVSFNTIKSLCESWNGQKENFYKMRFRVYSTIPTMSMVMIDPEKDTGEIVIEFFLYQSGEYRPRFNIIKTNDEDNLFNTIYEEFSYLWNNARRVV